MTARPEVVALLVDFEAHGTSSAQQFVHRDRRPFTDEETDLVGTATDEDVRAAAGQLAGVTERLAELLMPYIRTVAEEMGDSPPTTEAT
jgi:hypothetical protein